MILGQEENKKSLSIAIEQGLPTLLVGETGTGKTTLVREYAEQHGAELLRISCSGQTSTDEILGKWLIRGKETYWQDGAIPQAMRNGWWVVVDEVNSALPEVLFSLHSLLDDDKKITLIEKDGEVVRPHENFRFFATMNPTEDYAGTKELNKAFLSRFAIVLQVEYPEAKTEVEVLKNAGVSASVAKLMVGVANKLREAKDKEKIFYTCSTRDLLYWARLSANLGLDRAFEVGIMNKADSDRGEIHNIYAQAVNPIVGVEKKYGVNTLDELERHLNEKIKEQEQRFNDAERKIKELEEKKNDIIQSFLRAKIGESIE